MKSNLKILALLIVFINQADLTIIIEKLDTTQSVKTKSLELCSVGDSDEKLTNFKNCDEKFEFSINSTVELLELPDANWSPGPMDVYFELGIVDDNLLHYFQYFRMTAIPGQIARLVVSITLERIIHGIRIQSFNDTGHSAQIIDGGLNHYFMTIRFIGRTDHFLFLVEGFHDRTLTTSSLSLESTTLVPDREVEHWGSLNSESILLSENRHYLYPSVSITADRIITEYPRKTIHSIWLYALNGTRAGFELVEGGLGHDFVAFRFFGNSPGQGFDFRLELFHNSGNLGKLSLILIIFLTIVHLTML